VYDQCLPNNQPAGQRIGAAFPLLLGFALALAVAASGLVLGLGFQERRRTFAILTVPSPALRSFGVVRSPKPRRCHVRAVQA
jgi:hypothetical protein